MRSSMARIFESEEALQRELQTLNCRVVVEEHVTTFHKGPSHHINGFIPDHSKEITIRDGLIDKESSGKKPPGMTFHVESVFCGRSVHVIHQVHRLPTKTYTYTELLFQGIYPSEQVKISNQTGYPLLIEQRELLPGEAQEFAPHFLISFPSDLQKRTFATWHKVTMNLGDLPCKDLKIQDVFMIKIEKEDRLLKKSTMRFVFYFLKSEEEFLECRQDRIRFICGENVHCTLGQSILVNLEIMRERWIPRRRFLEEGLTVNGKELFAPNKIERKPPENLERIEEDLEEVFMEDDFLLSPRNDLPQDASSVQRESHSHTDHREDDDQKSE